MLNRSVSLKTLLIALLGLAGLGALAGGIAIFFGLAPISARPPHLPVTTAVLHTVFKNNVSRRADTAAPADLEAPGRIALGAQHYANVCAKCHGGPELGQNPVALSMRPRPQHLPAVVDQFTAEELYVILRDGVRLSAMPAWPADRNFDEIWSVVAFLQQLPQMDSETYVTLTRPTDPATVPLMSYAGGAGLTDSRTGILAPPVEEYLYATPSTEWPEIASTGHPVARCANCHGADGSGDTTEGRAPNLTLLSAAYITDSLDAYAAGTRHSGVMKVVAAGLTPDQRAALGRYYASLPDVTRPAPAPAPKAAALAQTLLTEGKPREAVAACYSCHQRGAAPATADALYVPNIAGQNADYLRQQLHAFRLAVRGQSGPYNPMPHEAASLTDEEIDALARTLASLPPDTVGDDTPAQIDTALAQGITERVCARCHTETGVGTPSGEYPNLTVHTAPYIGQQLDSFRALQRDSERMHQAAQRLSDADIASLAAYYGDRTALPSPGEVDPARAARGETIARNGVPDQGVPSCLSCHGSDSTARLPLIARLHGQNAAYLSARLDYFARESSLPLPGLNPMHPIARDLTEDQRQDIAAWFASQPPLPK